MTELYIPKPGELETRADHARDVIEQAARIIRRARSVQEPKRRFCACGQELMGKMVGVVFCGECQLKRDFRWGAAWHDRFKPTQPPAQPEVIEHAWMTATSEGP